MSDYLTTAEVADLVRKRPATVLAWMHSGKLPKAGETPGGYLFDRAAVERFIGAMQEPVKHASVDPAQVRAFVDAAYRKAVLRQA